MLVVFKQLEQLQGSVLAVGKLKQVTYKSLPSIIQLRIAIANHWAVLHSLWDQFEKLDVSDFQTKKKKKVQQGVTCMLIYY